MILLSKSLLVILSFRDRTIVALNRLFNIGLSTYEDLNLAVCNKLDILYGMNVKRVRHGNGQGIAYLVYYNQIILYSDIFRHQFYYLGVDLIIGKR